MWVTRDFKIAYQPPISNVRVTSNLTGTVRSDRGLSNKRKALVLVKWWIEGKQKFAYE